MLPPLRKPSPALQEWIRATAASAVVDDALGSWPRRLAKERGQILLHGDQAYLYYLQPDGVVVAVDTDRVGLNPEEASARDALNAVAQASARDPERRELLRDLLPERPEHARACARCGGTGRESPYGPCVCAGLGWVVDDPRR